MKKITTNHWNNDLEFMIWRCFLYIVVVQWSYEQCMYMNIQVLGVYRIWIGESQITGNNDLVGLSKNNIFPPDQVSLRFDDLFRKTPFYMNRKVHWRVFFFCFFVFLSIYLFDYIVWCAIDVWRWIIIARVNKTLLKIDDDDVSFHRRQTQ